MNQTTRMEQLFRDSRQIAAAPPASTFHYDVHRFALGKYKTLALWEKIARSMADAIEKQAVYIQPYDKIIGRVYYACERPPEAIDPNLDYNLIPRSRAEEMYPGYAELCRCQLANWGTPGHVAWDWNLLLRQGTEGLRRQCEFGLKRRREDPKSVEFYSGVLIMLDALDRWNDKHVAELERMGKTEEAAICRRVPRYPARNFREAVQSFFMQYIVVMKENPYGGNSPGRLDYYLWPYLEKDLKDGVCTEQEAQELMEELFIRIDERLYRNDGWGETVVVGGSHPNGTSAVNPLSYIMVKAFMKYDLTHPYLYVRLPKEAPPELLDLCAHYVKCGNNRAQLLNDASIINALVNNGVPYADAADYYCGGCMEIGIQGKTSDFLFTGLYSVPKLLELCMTGGYCLRTHTQMTYFRSRKLTDCATFEEFYAVFLAKAREIFPISFAYQDRLSESSEQARPAYLLSSMIHDCMASGRNMHGGGARYHDYGASLLGIPNAADSLYAIQKAVFEEKLCTAEELIAALDADFVGYETLQRQLINLPKYGMENAGADAMAARLTRDLHDIFASYVNRFGGNCKPVILTFTWAPEVGDRLGATPDGRRAGMPVAQAVTPQSTSMTKGITAAMNSCTSLPFECFTGGAATMWDLDASWASEEIIRSLFTAFFAGGGQIFQGNVTDVETLIKAQQNPEQYPHLIVKVGGFSARFVWLSKAVQDDIIHRIRHSC